MQLQLRGWVTCHEYWQWQIQTVPAVHERSTTKKMAQMCCKVTHCTGCILANTRPHQLHEHCSELQKHILKWVISFKRTLIILIGIILESVEHCGGEPEQADTAYLLAN